MPLAGAAPASAIEAWRAEATRVRQLAENNVPLAYRQAQGLQATLPPGATPADRVRVLNLLARVELYLAQTETAGARAEQAFALALEHGDKIGQAEANLTIAMNAVNQGRIDRLISATTHSLKVLDGADRPDLMAEAMLRTAMLYLRLGNKTDEVVALCVRSLEMANRSRNPLALTYAHHGMAIAFSLSEHRPESRKHFREMAANARAAGSKLLETDALIGVSSTGGNPDELRQHEKVVRAAIADYRALGTPFYLANSLNGLAFNLGLQHRYAEAAQAYDEVVEIYSRVPNRIGLWWTLSSRSATNLKLGKPAEAEADVARAYGLAQTIGLPQYLSESATQLAQLAAARGDYRRAYKYAAESGEVTLKASRDKLNERVLELAQRYELEGRQRQIDALTRRNEQQSAELLQHTLEQRWLWTLLGAAFLVLSGSAYFVLRLRRSTGALQRQSGILQSILDNMGEGVAVADEQGKLALVNPVAERMVGLDRSENGAQGWKVASSLFLPDQTTPYPPAELPLARALRGEASDGVEVFVTGGAAQQGRWLNVSGRPIFGPSGDVRGGVAVISDITARKAAEEHIRALNANLELIVQKRTEELRQQTRYLRVLIDTLPWWVWFKDTDSRYVAVNQAVADTEGMTVHDMVGKTDLEFKPRELAVKFRADDMQVMRTRTQQTVEETQMSAHGMVWLEIFKAPVIDEDGTLLGTVGFARDISERKLIESVRESALAEAQRLARLRSEFLAQMSHELRTPLNAVLGYAQLLAQDPALDRRQLDGVNVIRQSGEHLLMLINDLLDSAKIEADKLELYPVDFVFARFLRGLADMVTVRARQKGVAFVCDFAPDLPITVHADEMRLRQALLNLLANAVKFTEHGQVTLRVRGAPGNRLRFEVQDTGIGIEAAQLETIFQPFEQAGDAQRRIGGTGLGLSISRQFVRLMGGEIVIDSQVGEGSLFWFELALPAGTASIAPLQPGRLATGYEGRRQKILVIDSMADNRALALDLLGRLGFEVAAADNGRSAVVLAGQLKPDLIVLDIAMPETDGLATSRLLRALPELQAVPIIAVSASVTGIDEERNLAVGMDAFLPKPLDLVRLLELVGGLLKLTWTYRPAPDDSTRKSEPGPLVVPPPSEMAVLYRLARIGNMRDIIERADYLAALDTRYVTLAEQLRQLASRYQSKAILRLVERYHEPAPET